MIFGIGETKKIEEAYKKSVVCEGNAYSSSRFLSKAIRVDEANVVASSFRAIGERVGYEPKPMEKGGIIVFSTDVNSRKQSNNRVVDWLKKKMKTVANRLNFAKKVDDIADAHELVGWTIGKFLNGRYTGKDGKRFSENSLSVEIVGIDTETLIRIAEELCVSFDQESALVKDYSTGRVLFVENDTPVMEGYVPLTEASLTHILGKRKYGEGYVVVSACRGDWDEDDREQNNRLNNEKTRELKRAAKEAGFGYVPVYGGFIENFGTDKAKDVFERSLMVFPYSNRGEKRDFSELKDWAKDMGIRFNQDAVLIKEPDEDGEAKAPYYLVTADRDGNSIGDKQEWFGKDTYKVNDIAQQYFTSMHKKSRRHEKDDNPRRFSLTEGAVGEGRVRVFVNRDPKCYSGAHSRYMAGELFNYSR